MATKIPSPFIPWRMKRIWRGTLIGIVIGVVAGLGALAFNWMVDMGTRLFTGDLVALLAPGYNPEQLFLGFPIQRWMMLWIPALGGILSGLIVFKFAPEAEGHGTDAMIESFHTKKGVVRSRTPVIKAIASALTIGSGGSAGKEGPITQIGSGFGSMLASYLKASDAERRIMLLAGAAAGMGAIFKSPLGAAIFAVEVLYNKEDFEFEALIPAILSSFVAFTVFTVVDGTATIFHIPAFSLATPGQLPIYAVLGMLCALAGFLWIRTFYGMRNRLFRRLSFPKSLKPAVGGLMLGVIAFFLPEVLGGGYNWIQSAIDGQLTFWLMAALVLAKVVASSFTISSGGSGGAFAPSLFIGAMLGGSYGNLCGRLFPHIVIEPSAFVIVGMGGFLAGVAKVPIAAIIMVAEMTGGYSLILPMMVVSGLSYLLLGRITLFEKQVPTRVDSPAHLGDYVMDVMDHLRVKDVVAVGEKVETIPEDMGFEDILRTMADSHQQDFPVVDADNALSGILSITDLRRIMGDFSNHRSLTAKEMAIPGVTAVTMEDSLNTALKIMADLDVRELPVVTKENMREIVAVVSRKGITRTYLDTMDAQKRHGI